MHLKLFLSASDSESSEDSQCDQEDILEEEMLDDTVTEDTQVDSEKDDQHLVIKLFAYMLLAWQTLFKVSDGAQFALLRCLKHVFSYWTYSRSRCTLRAGWKNPKDCVFSQEVE